MAQFTIKNPEEFVSELRKLETTDRNHADVFNALFDTLINNDAFLKKVADRAVEHIKNNAIHVPSMEGVERTKYLRSDGTWQTPPDTNTTYGAATQSINGLMSATDKAKLDGIAANANNYSHPSTHAASMISQDATHRFVTDNEKSTWNGKAGTGTVSQSANGLMSANDKKKLDGIAANANNYSHPSGNGNNHIPSGGSSGQILRWSAAGTAVWGSDNNTTYGAATQSANGLMSANDKKKLDGIAANANNYSHPSTHAASMISQDASHRFVSDSEKNSWNGKANGNHAHDYLPLTGGTLRGSLVCQGTFAIKVEQGKTIVWGDNTNNNPFIVGSKNSDGYNQICLGVQGWDTSDQLRYRVFFGSTGGGVGGLAIWPGADNLYALGAGGNRFKALYAATGTIQTSDRNYKKQIEEFEEDFIQEFIMGLKPVSYMLKDNESGRTHYGLIAQDVEDLMKELGMNSKDFAGFIKTPKTEEVFDFKTKDSTRKVIEGEYLYALRYEEFLSPLIKMVQLQQEKIEQLQERVNGLEKQVSLAI